MAEWSKAPVLKTGVSSDTVGSNPTLSVLLLFMSTLHLTRFRIPSFLRTGQYAKAAAGRNHNGRITVRHRGAGHPRALRSIQ